MTQPWRVLVAGTRNPAKVAVLTELVAGLATVRPAARDLSSEDDEVIESGDDLREIARRKALAFSRFEPGQIVVATDGGLVVPALAGWRPSRTKRFAGRTATNRERADRLLAMAAGLTGSERRIWRREAMAVARDSELLAEWVAESPPGLLATGYDPAQLIGDNGFWLPAIWCCPEYGGKRLADLTPVERTGRSNHWQLLGQKLRALLEELP